jgi:pyruvate,water dikinase
MTATFDLSAIDWAPPGPGPWQQDSAHTPVSQTAAIIGIYPPGFNRGFTETFARYGLLLDRLAMGSVNGFTYHQPQPFDLPGPDGPKTPDEIGAEFGRRLGIATEALEAKMWLSDLDDWDTNWKPAAIARHREFSGVDLSALDDDGLIDHLRAVAAHTTEMVYQHHRFNVAAIFPVGDFALQAAGMLHMDPRSLFAALDGYSPISAVVSDEIAPVIEALRRDPDSAALVADAGDPAKRLEALRQRCPEVDTYVRTAGPRLLDGFDVVSPTQLERPELLLGRMAAALDAGPDEARPRADAFAAELRSRLADDQRIIFDDLLADARAVYRLRDERGIYSEVTAIGLLRLAMLEAGRRLAAAGTITDPEVIFDSTLDELVAFLTASPTVDEATLIERRQRRLALCAAGAPRFLGPPPPAPPSADQLPPPLGRLMSAVGFCIEGILGQLDHAGGNEKTIAGIGVSAGAREGTARVVRSLEELDRVEPGDILVAPATSEAFTAMLHLVDGIVTDHGSFICHAAIVSREMGIPAVVGTVDATHRIPDGARIRIDGTAGEVTILG